MICLGFGASSCRKEAWLKLCVVTSLNMFRDEGKKGGVVRQGGSKSKYIAVHYECRHGK